jgi:hypothetical protein
MTQLSPASNVRMSVLVIQNSGVRNKSGLPKNFQNYYITTNFTFQNERYNETKAEYETGWRASVFRPIRLRIQFLKRIEIQTDEDDLRDFEETIRRGPNRSIKA